MSNDLMRSMVTNHVAFNKRDLHSTCEFECAMDHRYQVLVFKLETLHTINFTKLSRGPTQFWELFTVMYHAPKNFKR